jgi:DNA-binding NtrC family response regulator
MPSDFALPPAPPQYAPPAPEPPADDAAGDVDPASPAPEAEDEHGGSLAAVAKAASMKAEKALIEKTLDQVHWNRRKAAQILGVSYKTLLNKIKECNITRD